MSAVCSALPGGAVCHPIPLFGPVSTRCPVCCGFTTAAAAADREQALRLQQIVYGGDR